MKLLLVIILQVSIRCCSCTIKCELTTPSISLSPIDTEEVVSYFESIQFGPKILDDVAITEFEIFKQVLNYETGCDNEDIHLNITQLITKYGYKAEEHHIQTKDGYEMAAFRIYRKGTPVLLWHGNFGSSDDYVTMGPDISLAYQLAAAGYDVWLGNNRGNKYSREHVSLSPECSEFWDFSWDEIGRYDLPATIDYVLNITGHAKLAYVGYSQGTTVSFVLASELPEYNEKLSLIVTLSQIVILTHLKSPLVRTAALASDVGRLVLDAIGHQEIAPNNAFTQTLANIFCGSNGLAEIVCSNFAFIVTGFDHGQINYTNFPVFIGHFPSGSGTKQLIHYGQLALGGRFCKYDHGEKKNREVYGCDTPPDYPLDKVTAPVALFYSNNDWLSSMTDAAILRDRLPNVVDFNYIDNYSHLDYPVATNLKELVNDRILELLKIYA